jgi:hypothetical protein
MSIASIGNSGFSAMAAGVRGQMNAQILSQVLDSAGLLEPELDAALQAVDATSQSLVAAGAVVTQSDLLGTLFDAMA